MNCLIVHICGLDSGTDSGNHNLWEMIAIQILDVIDLEQCLDDSNSLPSKTLCRLREKLPSVASGMKTKNSDFMRGREQNHVIG